MGYWLPTLRCTRLSFLQAILSGAKEVIKTKDVKLINISQNWNEWCVKSVWPMVQHEEAI